MRTFTGGLLIHVILPLLVSASVMLTGGIGSLLTPLYVLPIVAAGTVRFRRGALQAAALCATLYGAVVAAPYVHPTDIVGAMLGWTFDAALPAARVAFYTAALNIGGLFAVAFLAGSLAERVRRADGRLEKASEQIADLRFFNQFVIDNLVSGLATADEQHRLLTFNRSAIAVTARGLSDVLGKSASDVLQLPDGFTQRLDAELEGIRSKRADLYYRRGDGATIILGLAVAPMPLPDGARRFLYTFQDVTETKRLAREAQLQKRLAAVGEMAAGIAHEIRNPLASMSGSMQILRQELQLSSDQAHLMDIVLRESERLNDTIRSFLAYARPQHVDRQQLDLRGVLQDTATLLRNSHEVGGCHGIEVIVADQQVTIDGDENQVRQIVWNLATNSLRAMPHGGTLTLTASVDDARGNAAVLTLTDQGVGIGVNEVDAMFQPFRGSGKGTGLGLAIVHRILSDYGAAIDVQSQPGRGTTFRVSFPPCHSRQERAGDERASLDLSERMPLPARGEG
jgi:two-component system sensor histidine kinase PilS (NtrC family)